MESTAKNPWVRKNETWPFPTWPVQYWDYKITFSEPGMKTYNPETHELVEKKEAKIARLNDELERIIQEDKLYEDSIVSMNVDRKNHAIKMTELRKELKQLE